MTILGKLYTSKSVKEEELTSLIDSTVDSIEKTKSYIFSENISKEEKKSILLKDVLNNSFYIKRVYNDDIIRLDCGYRDKDDYFVYNVGLTKEVNNSRFWLYDIQNTIEQKRLLEENEFKGIILISLINSATFKYVTKHYDMLGNGINKIINIDPNTIASMIKF